MQNKKLQKIALIFSRLPNSTKKNVFYLKRFLFLFVA